MPSKNQKPPGEAQKKKKSKSKKKSNTFRSFVFGSSVSMANSGTMRDATQISAEEIKQEEYTELSKRRRIGFSKRKGKETRR